MNCDASPKLQIVPFFDPATSTYSYVVADTDSRQCALIDAVLDYDPASGRTSHASADRMVAHVREQGLSVQWILETHVHADHLSAGTTCASSSGANWPSANRYARCRTPSPPCSTLSRALPAMVASSTPVPRRRSLPDRRHPRPGPAYPRAYPGVHELPDRRCRIRRRHPVHARLRHRALRFPRWRCAHPVPLDPEAVRPARRNAGFPVPRLPGTGSRAAPARNHDRRGAPRQRSCA